MEYFTKVCVWVLTVFGAANGLAFAALLNKPREWLGKKSAFLGKLFACPMCLGFWLGIISGLLIFSPTGNIIADGFFGSATSWIIYLLIRDSQFKA